MSLHSSKWYLHTCTVPKSLDDASTNQTLLLAELRNVLQEKKLIMKVFLLNVYFLSACAMSGTTGGRERLKDGTTSFKETIIRAFVIFLIGFSFAFKL